MPIAPPQDVLRRGAGRNQINVKKATFWIRIMRFVLRVGAEYVWIAKKVDLEPKWAAISW